MGVLLPDGAQVALFRLDDGSLHAVGNIDPFSGAAVMSRGIVGDRGGRATVQSPIKKQAFALDDGSCLDDPAVRCRCTDARHAGGYVEVGRLTVPSASMSRKCIAAKRRGLCAGKCVRCHHDETSMLRTFRLDAGQAVAQLVKVSKRHSEFIEAASRICVEASYAAAEPGAAEPARDQPHQAGCAAQRFGHHVGAAGPQPILKEALRQQV